MLSCRYKDGGCLFQDGDPLTGLSLFYVVVEVGIRKAELLHDVALELHHLLGFSFTLSFDFVVEVGIRKAELLHDVAFELLHLLGLLVLDMVIT